jgi:hypothetical protein
LSKKKQNGGKNHKKARLVSNDRQGMLLFLAAEAYFQPPRGNLAIPSPSPEREAATV